MGILNDHDPVETQEWVDSLRAVLQHAGPDRARHLLTKLREEALLTGTMPPFLATTPCTHNIEPLAWKRVKQSFPWQVRVDDSRAFKAPLTADDLAKFIPLTSTKLGLMPPTELIDEQVQKLLAAFKIKNP